MAVNPTSVWRVRPSGSNANGGGFDCSISPAAAGTNGSLSGVTFTDATAAAFTSGMAGSAINISGVGQFLIATYVSATQITLAVGAGGSLPQLPGGAAWTVGAGQDYSQQNAAQASGSHGTATGTATFIDATANAFTAAMVGNCIQIASGAGFTAGFYFVTAYTSASTVTLDRSPGTGTVAAWALGGGWADFWTNTTSSGPLVPGNVNYILGSGVPNPASYTYDYTASEFSPAQGSNSAGRILYANDPATPGYKAPPDTTGGMPCIKAPGTLFNGSGSDFVNIAGLWFVLSGTSGGGLINLNVSSCFGCVLDQFGQDFSFNDFSDQSYYCSFIGCEVFSSVAPGSAGSNSAFSLNFSSVIGCNVHDTVGPGIYFSDRDGVVQDTIVAKCRGFGIKLNGNSSFTPIVIKNNTIDGNIGNGVDIAGQITLTTMITINNLITNHTQAGTYGLTVDSGTAAINNALVALIDYQVYYNNATDVSAISYGPHDTQLIVTPYVSSATEDYTLA